jgi:hypothetical protein
LGVLLISYSKETIKIIDGTQKGKEPVKIASYFFDEMKIASHYFMANSSVLVLLMLVIPLLMWAPVNKGTKEKKKKADSSSL